MLQQLQPIEGSSRRLRGRSTTLAFLVGVAVAAPWSIVHAQNPASKPSADIIQASNAAQAVPAPTRNQSASGSDTRAGRMQIVTSLVRRPDGIKPVTTLVWQPRVMPTVLTAGKQRNSSAVTHTVIGVSNHGVSNHVVARGTHDTGAGIFNNFSSANTSGEQGAGLEQNHQTLATSEPETQLSKSQDADARRVAERLSALFAKPQNADAETVAETLSAVLDKRSTAPRANRSAFGMQEPQTRLFKLHYAEADTIAATLSTLYVDKTRQDVKIVADRRTNTVIVQATPEKLQEISNILDNLDVNAPDRSVTFVIQIKFAKANVIADALHTLFEDQDSKSVRLATDIRTNSIIIQANELKINEISNIIHQLDVNR